MTSPDDDHEDTVLRPARAPMHDPSPSVEEPDTSDTVLRPAWAPVEESGTSDTVLRPAPGPTDVIPEDTRGWHDDADGFISGVPQVAPAPENPPPGEAPDLIMSGPPRSTGDPATPAPEFAPAEPAPPEPDAAEPGAAEPDASEPEPADPAPWGTYLPSGLLTDDAPIQRFDQRPRFDPLPEDDDLDVTHRAAAASTATDGIAPAAPRRGTAATTRRPGDATTPESDWISSSGSPGAPPGIDATGPRRRKLLIPAIALGCSLLLLLGIAGAVGALWLNGRVDPSAAPQTTTAQADPAQWRPLDRGEEPAGTPEQLTAVMAENPLMAATLPVPGQCELPASEGKVPDEELQSYLEAGAACLETMWTQALDPQGVAFDAPIVVVHPADRPPSNSACTPESFTGQAPRSCIGDNTLYWPQEWDPGFSTTSAAESPQLYLWHLSYSYAVFAISSTSLHGYYGALLEGVEQDQDLSDETRRRYALQQSCLASASAFQLPTGPRPSDRVEEFVTSVEAQAEPGSTAEPSADARASWVGAGRDARGDLSVCNTWRAPADQVG